MFAALTALVLAAGPPAAPCRVGQIIIIGNAVTPQPLILERLPLFPGQLLSATGIADANRSLASLRVYGVDAEARAEDDLFNEGSPFKTIRVEVRESWPGYFVGLAYELRENVISVAFRLVDALAVILIGWLLPWV